MMKVRCLLCYPDIVLLTSAADHEPIYIETYRRINRLDRTEISSESGTPRDVARWKERSETESYREYASQRQG